MTIVTRYGRFFSNFQTGNKNHRLYSSISANGPSEPIISSSILSNQFPSSTPSPPEKAAAGRAGGMIWSFLKCTLFAACGASGTAGYVTERYTVDEVDEKAKALRALAKVSVSDDMSSFDKFLAMLKSTTVTVAANIVELYVDLRVSAIEHIRSYAEPYPEMLLPDLHPQEQHVFTLVLDLNETLLYSDWKRDRGWRTFKRPGVDDFLEQLAQLYEIVVYSDQQAMDLSKLNRDPSRILYVSGNALENCLQPENCVPIKPWKCEVDDTALLDLIPFLEYVALHRPADIRLLLASYQGCDIAKEFIERSKEHEKKLQQKQQGRLWRRWYL